jgi:hypothetical protein
MEVLILVMLFSDEMVLAFLVVMCESDGRATPCCNMLISLLYESLLAVFW